MQSWNPQPYPDPQTAKLGDIIEWNYSPHLNRANITWVRTIGGWFMGLVIVKIPPNAKWKWKIKDGIPA